MNQKQFMVELIGGEIYSPKHPLSRKILDILWLIGETIAFALVLSAFMLIIWELALYLSPLVMQ